MTTLPPDLDALRAAHDAVSALWPDAAPACGLILGSGWSDVASVFDEIAVLPYDRVPGLGRPGVAGHAGRLVRGRLEGLETWVFQGRRHWYEGEGWTPVALPVYLLKQAGARVLVLTNAAGGIRDDLVPGTLMMLTDHISNLPSNPLLGPHDPAWGPRFPDQSSVYDLRLREALTRAAGACRVETAEGVYLATSGPAYETPAEVRDFGRRGADAVGMSTVPEAMLGSAAGLRVAAVSCITNHAAGIAPQPLSHEDVTKATQQAMPRMARLVAAFWKELSHERLSEG